MNGEEELDSLVGVEACDEVRNCKCFWFRECGDSGIGIGTGVVARTNTCEQLIKVDYMYIRHTLGKTVMRKFAIFIIIVLHS